MHHKRYGFGQSPLHVFNFLLQEERRGGVILVMAAAAALLLVNSGWGSWYEMFIRHELQLGMIVLDVRQWVGEGLMALFFLMVTLEVKREVLDGELRTWRKASFPFVAAVGGMIVPALLYALCNPTGPRSVGWAVPIATDIAIAVGVLALLGRRVPKSLRIFLLALAIVDDIGSIIIIALFYSRPDNVLALLLAVVLGLVLLGLRRYKWWVAIFAGVGAVIWYCLLVAGVSGVLAGVLLAAAAPYARRSGRTDRLLPAEKVEDMLLPLTAYGIVPLFVFVNSGLVLRGMSMAHGEFRVFSGVAVGLVVGKPAGILGATLLAQALGLAHKPRGIRWFDILGVGCMAGAGFTVSMLIISLSFGDHSSLRDAATLGVFVATILSSMLGAVILLARKRSRIAIL